MAFYHDLKRYRADPAEPGKANWIAARLLALREQLRQSPLVLRGSRSLVIGSWNLRAFDEGRPRRDESYHYVAEIIDKFDVCAVQEVKEDLAPLRRLVRLLGPNWDYFVTDVTEGGPGNRERQAFLYDTNKVRFRNLVGEIVLPEEERIEGRQIARTPFFASFQAGWFRFTLVNVHIVYGGSSAAQKALRAAEVETLARKIATRAKAEDEVYVLIGDMNIEAPGDAIMAGLTANGLTVPFFGPTNLGGGRYFDQIAFTGEDVKTNLVRSGSFDWRGAVYRPEDQDHYRPIAEAARGAPYSNWDTAYQTYFASFEMSDHLPIWVEIRTDYSDDYLRRFTGGG
jgi:endonuclease/exonuclease/phosphatase family metal-dependent hydrolase